MEIILPTLRKDRRESYSPFLPICKKSGKVLEVGITIISKDDYKIIKSQPFHSGLDQSRFIPLAYYLQSHQSIYSNSLLMMNTTKLVDRGYRGNLKAYFYNVSDNDIVLNTGDKLGLVVPTFHSYLYEINIFGEEENMQDPTKRQDDIHINYYPNDYL